jgi:glutathione peroxidase
MGVRRALKTFVVIPVWIVFLAVAFVYWKRPDVCRHFGSLAWEAVQIRLGGGGTVDDSTSLTIYNFTENILDADGNPYDFLKHQQSRDVLMIMNTASECGLTRSGYTTAVTLHEKYKARGFQVIGFPCNQFGNQEPGSSADVKEFASQRFSIDFPILEKVDVNGPTALPLWEFLKTRLAGALGVRSIEWNFTMFLVDRNGVPRFRFPPGAKIQVVEEALAQLLDEK